MKIGVLASGSGTNLQALAKQDIFLILKLRLLLVIRIIHML
ncbi:MAG: hypothetical protein ACXADY_21475 [Candidatus Hodarchaeales archaeon]|jgi:folate-dependent phosphoribosylglycinamide formyltransferase PurN